VVSENKPHHGAVMVVKDKSVVKVIQWVDPSSGSGGNGSERPIGFSSSSEKTFEKVLGTETL
jgi:hypothetical protein